MARQSAPTAADAPTLDLPQAEGVAAVRWAARSCRFSFRGDAAAARAIGSAFGAMPPLEPLRSSHQLLSAALWLGPDEWLLLAPISEASHILTSITRALGSKPHALVDISARNVGLVVTGPRADDALAAGCPLDLDRAVFPAGMCTRTLFGKAEIVLWRTAADAFRIELVRSYLPYVVGLLAQAISDERALRAHPPASVSS